jgi:ribonuclease BN (tRNA processing enzyme)
MARLTLLGTGGGRFTTLTQTRATGGVYLEDGPARLHIDPGPGAINQLRAAGRDPMDTTGVLVSHRHLDHANDVNIAIAGMTQGGLEERGFLVGSESVIEGHGEEGPVVTERHRNLVTETITARPGQAARVSGRRVGFLETEHRDPTNVGFKIETSAGTVTYFTDTIAREDLVDQLEGTRVLLLGVTRPRGAHIPDHMSTEDAVDIAERIQPDLLAMTHLGLKLIRRGPEPEARYVEQETGVRTIAAQDLAELTIEEEIELEAPPAPTPEAKG